MERRRRDKGEKGVESDLRWDGGLFFRHRPVISNQLWLTDSGGKFLGVNAACHSEGAGVSSWESEDEGRINWHSGGERWRESDGGPADGHTLSRSIHRSFFSRSERMYCTECFLGGVVKAAGSERRLVSMFLIVICINYVKLNVLKKSQQFILLLLFMIIIIIIHI